jgi:hypothetical protein
MHQRVLVHNFLCYDARSLHDANLVVLWGSFSKKLSSLIAEEVQANACNRVLLHMRGCEHRIDNDVSMSSLEHVLPINRSFANCKLDRDEMKALLCEARSCLKA